MYNETNLDRESFLREILKGYGGNIPSIFTDYILPVIKKNTDGRMLLVGGAITRFALNMMYGWKLPVTNFDIVVDKMNEYPIIPSDWKLQKTIHGGWKLIFYPTGDSRLSLHTDVWTYKSWLQNMKNLNVSIHEAIENVPFNTGQVAFDLEVPGKIYYTSDFIAGVVQRKIWITNLGEHELLCQRANVTPRQDLNYRANRMFLDFDL